MNQIVIILITNSKTYLIENKRGLTVASLLTNSNFIGQKDLIDNEITAQDMSEFLDENHLTWAVRELGPWLGSIALFYKRTETDLTNVKQNPQNATPLSPEELLEIKSKYL